MTIVPQNRTQGIETVTQLFHLLSSILSVITIIIYCSVFSQLYFNSHINLRFPRWVCTSISESNLLKHLD